MKVGDRVRLAPTTPRIRLHNMVGDTQGTIVGESPVQDWVVQWPDAEVLSGIRASVFEHDLELMP